MQGPSDEGGAPARTGPEASGGGTDLPAKVSDSPELPPPGLPLQIAGFWTAFGGSFPLGLGIMESEPVLVMIGGLIWVAGGALFGWGWAAKTKRNRAISDLEERDAVRAAVAADGVLTATLLASQLGVSIASAETLLLRMEDGLRVVSRVREDGTLVFEFPEVRNTRSLPGRDG